MRTSLVVVGVGLGVLVSSCRSELDCGRPGEETLDCLLLASLAEQLDLMEVPQLVSDSVRMRGALSEVVPELSYVTATYRPPDSDDMLAYAYGVSGPGGVRVFRTIEDWSAVLGSWTASDENDAVGACGELAVLSASAIPYRTPFVYDESMNLKDFDRFRFVYVDVDPDLERLSSPTVSRDTRGVWSVSLWVVQIGAAQQLRCVLDGMRTRLEPLQTFTTIGLIPYGP